ncbi:MAG: hypothetical protein D3917_05385, partial [Candidatus Electrothrix sp. AX5]|nr:hypothetical protein [Candidatus Electrothrix sp. AX5]
MEHAITHASHGTTLFFTGVLILLIVSLALEEKIHAKKSLIVGLFAAALLLLDGALGLLPFGPITLPNGHTLNMPVYIEAIDWGVIAIIIGS